MSRLQTLGAKSIWDFKHGATFPTNEDLRRKFIEAEIRQCSIHEAGHIVAALNIGIPIAKGRIYRRNNGDVWGIRSIGGWMTTLQSRRKLQDAVIGYAGVVAEMLADNIETDVWDVLAALDGEEIVPSESDWNSIREIHDSWQKRALVRCIEILKANWKRVEAVAAELVIELEWSDEIVADEGRRDSGCYFTAETMEAGR